MDCVAAAAMPAAVDVDDALSSGVVVNGRKLAAQQRLAAAAAAAAAATAARAPPKPTAAAASASTGTPGEGGAPPDGPPPPFPSLAVDGAAAASNGADRADGGDYADGAGAESGAAVTSSAAGSGAAAISAAAAAAAVAARARGSQRVSAPRSRLASRLVFNASEPTVKKEILSIIAQYLRDEGFASASASIAIHAGVKAAMAAATRADIRRMRGAILDGDWATVESLCGSEVFKTVKPFHYAVGRQQYLELIDGHEFQKAFALLTKRLKPLESYRFRMDEFRDLCYLLTCKSVTDACSFRDWNGVAAYRERLVEQFAHLLTVDAADEEEGAGGPGGGGGGPPHPPRHGAALAAEPNGAAVPPASAAAVAAAPSGPPGRPSRTPASLLEQVPPHHLVHLLTQALEHQVSSSRYQPAVPPRIGSILSEYECFVVPNVQRHAMVGHTGNVKCTVFVGDEGLELASGSSDNTVALWETYSGARIGVLTGHTSRVWDVAASRNGGMLASASGDGTVRLWNRGGADGSTGGSVPCGSPREPEGVLGLAEKVGDVSSGDTGRGAMFYFKSVLLGHRGDVYAVQLHPNGRHVVTAGYDKTVRLFDVETNQEIRSFRGHNSSVATIAFKPNSNVVFTGSKDSTIKCWDMTSGRCTKTFSSHLGEVTSVDVNSAGTSMLSSSKDNSNRLWDLRLGKPLRRFKGHQNTSKNFIRSAFGPNESLVVGGSEDGLLYIWDVDTSCVVQKLGPCSGAVYAAKWNPYQSLLASCGHDGVVRTWWYDDSPSGAARGHSPGGGSIV